MTDQTQPAISSRATHAITPWVDGDPLMEAIAAAVWEHCEHHDSGLIIDDPRNIAAAVTAAARQNLYREAATLAESLRELGPAYGARKSAQVSENVGILRVAEELRRRAAEPQTADSGEGFCRFGVTSAPGSGCILPAGHEPANRHVVTPGDVDDD
jgi:hypothetical protein